MNGVSYEEMQALGGGIGLFWLFSAVALGIFAALIGVVEWFRHRHDYDDK